MKKVNRKLAFRLWWIMVILILTWTVPRMSYAQTHLDQDYPRRTVQSDAEITRNNKYRDARDDAESNFYFGLATIFSSWLSLGIISEPKQKKVKTDDKTNAPA